jgi:hypothetical protein
LLWWIQTFDVLKGNNWKSILRTRGWQELTMYAISLYGMGRVVGEIKVRKFRKILNAEDYNPAHRHSSTASLFV